MFGVLNEWKILIKIASHDDISFCMLNLVLLLKFTEFSVYFLISRFVSLFLF